MLTETSPTSTDTQRIALTITQHADGPKLNERDWDVIREKSAPMREQLQSLMDWCVEKGIEPDRIVPSERKLIVYATTEEADALAAEAMRRGIYKDTSPSPFRSQTGDPMIDPNVD